MFKFSNILNRIGNFFSLVLNADLHQRENTLAMTITGNRAGACYLYMFIMASMYNLILAVISRKQIGHFEITDMCK